MVSPKFHKRGASRDREGLSLTPTSRRRNGSLVEIAKAGISSPPLSLDDDADADADKTTRSNRSTKSSSGHGTKLKKRSKSKDSTKAAAKEKARSKLAECGYGSDGVLDDAKKRHREKRKERQLRDKDPDAYAYPDGDPVADDDHETTEGADSGSPESRHQVLKASRGASEPSLSPKRRDRSKSAMRRIANIFKSKDNHQSQSTSNGITHSTSNQNLDSYSTLNTEETSLTSPGSSSAKRDNSLRSVRSIAASNSGRLSKAKKRSNSSGPLRGGKKSGTSSASSVSSRLSDTPSGDEPLLDVPESPKSRKKGTTSSRSRSRSRSSERLPNGKDATGTATTKNGGIPQTLEEQVEELRDENILLQQQVERERQRSKRLTKKLKELKTQVEETNGHADTPITTSPTPTTTNNTNAKDPQIQELKHELERKVDRIVELERLVSSLKTTSKHSDYDLDVVGSNHDSIGSIGSCRSSSRGNDAIWHRLQTQLNETREELTRTEELLRAQKASLFLQTRRVEELEEELKTNGVDAIRILKEKCNLLQEENKELETKLSAERRDFEDRMQKKDEAIIYFRNELQKLKQQGNVDLQRTLVHAASQHSLLDTTSSHSTQSSTVQRAFGGFTQLVSPALWSKDKVNVDRNSLEAPRLDY